MSSRDLHTSWERRNLRREESLLRLSHAKCNMELPAGSSN